MACFIGLENKEGTINYFDCQKTELASIFNTSREELTIQCINCLNKKEVNDINEFYVLAKKDLECNYYLFNKEDRWMAISEFKN
jgi:hypothetical protein